MSTAIHPLETLARVPLLAGLGKRELLRVGQLTEVMDLPAGRLSLRLGAADLVALVAYGVPSRLEGSRFVMRGAAIRASAGPVPDTQRRRVCYGGSSP